MKKLSSNFLCHLLTLSLLLQTFGPVATAAVGTIPASTGVLRITTPGESVTGPDGQTGKLSIEVTATTIPGEGGANAAKAMVAQLISEREQESDPQVIVLVDPEQPASAETEKLVNLIPEHPGVVRELPRGWLSSLKERFYEWYSVPRNHQITLSVSQLVYEGVAVSATYIVGEGINVESAMTMGVLLGGISAAFTYKNSQWRKLLLGSRLTRAFFRYPEGQVPQALQQAEAFGIWLLADAAIVSVAMGAMWALGIPYGHDRTLAEAFTYTLLWDIGTEYTWDLAINTTNVRMKEYLPEANHEKIDRHTTTALWALSGVAAAGMVAQLMQLPYVEVVLGSITAVGALTFAGSLAIGPRKEREGVIGRTTKWFSSCAKRIWGEASSEGSKPN